MPNQTWRDVARGIATLEFGVDNLSDEQADFVLWNHTCFPVGSISDVAANLREFFRFRRPANWFYVGLEGGFYVDPESD